MPAVLALPAFWGAVAAGGAATAGIYGANKASSAAEDANKTQAASNAAAIEEQKRQDAQQKAEFDAQQAAAKAQWDAEQQIRAPYRAAGQQALLRLGDLIGTHFDPNAAMFQPKPFVPPVPPTPAPTMPLNSLMPPQAPMVANGPGGPLQRPVQT